MKSLSLLFLFVISSSIMTNLKTFEITGNTNDATEYCTNSLKLISLVDSLSSLRSQFNASNQIDTICYCIDVFRIQKLERNDRINRIRHVVGTFLFFCFLPSFFFFSCTILGWTVFKVLSFIV
ncbi:MAG: hypothetical protein Dasosvirus11_3 [Dasosvirus sp.]|uniref:Transmembrane protein n=1 Tax=Dasosvirus sp. TaxID=2487764 RepID=A0A3G4ZRQ9_9VIRU|nr:MAG: hypothetical protein Dasosvirus11_3 [Dasosvirus sp.]